MTDHAQARRAAREARAAARRRRERRTLAALLAVGLAVTGAAGLLLRPHAAASGDTAIPRAAGRAGAVPPSVPATALADAIVALSQPATLTVAAVGDMIFDRRVKALIQAKGGAEPLEEVAPHLSRADIAVGNLESPLSTGGTMDADKDVTFRGDPRGIEGLVNAGFDFLAMGNNHVLDYGAEALADTVGLLQTRGIGHAGAGRNRTAAWTPAVAERNGATVAFLSFSHILPPGFVATKDAAGLAQGRNNMDAVAAAIAQAKETHDYVLVSFHWGVEYVDDCNGDQVRDAHRAIDAGADMVLSHHPHVIQAVEFYKGKLIAYSLGDFVFDHYSRKTGEAFILDAELGPSGTGSVTVTPVYLDTNGKPEFVSGSAARSILERLKVISSKRGATVTIRGDIAVVTP